MLWILCWCQGRPDNQLYGLRTSLPKAKLSKKQKSQQAALHSQKDRKIPQRGGI